MSAGMIFSQTKFYLKSTWLMKCKQSFFFDNKNLNRHKIIGNRDNLRKCPEGELTGNQGTFTQVQLYLFSVITFDSRNLTFTFEYNFEITDIFGFKIQRIDGGDPVTVITFPSKIRFSFSDYRLVIGIIF